MSCFQDTFMNFGAFQIFLQFHQINFGQELFKLFGFVSMVLYKVGLYMFFSVLVVNVYELF